MSIQYAILGILSHQSLTGYDVKKIIQESPFMYWSANNNQIYKALVQLLDQGLVTQEVQHQESSPSKKIYTITEEGLAELKDWVQTTPEVPEIKKTFLIQLAWADLLDDAELEVLLSNYEDEVRMQLVLQEEKKRRGAFSPGRTSREAYIWNQIYSNVIKSYSNELEWIQELRKELCPDGKVEVNSMKGKVIEKKQKKYIQFDSPEIILHTEQDAMDFIAICMENETNLLMINGAVLSDDFFNLRTGLAGAVLQKFINYHVKASVYLTDKQKIKGRFKEFVVEANKGKDFRVFTNLDEAEEWLLS